MNIIYYLAHSMRMLQHRGKAYWKMAIGNAVVEREGSLPSDENILKIAKKEKLLGDNGIGYLSKRSPQFPSMKLIQVSLDGFFVDTEKLYLHPNIGQAKESDSLFKIYQIFVDLLIKKQNPERAAEFLDRHLKGNMILKLHDHIYAIRKNIGKEQANFLATDIDIDSAYAEPDYTRPMTLGFSIEYQKYSKTFEASEGIIKDRYDDSDHMIDFSEQISKNKLLTTGKSLKFVIRNLVQNKKVATIQGTIQTGSTARE